VDGSVREEDALNCGVGEREAGGGIGYGHYGSFFEKEKWLIYEAVM